MMAVAAHVLGNLAPRFGREALRHVAQGAMEIFIHLLRRVLRTIKRGDDLRRIWRFGFQTIAEIMPRGAHFLDRRLQCRAALAEYAFG